MEEAIPAETASRNFFLVLQQVREGHRYVVTSHGQPVACIVPVDTSGSPVPGGRAVLLSRLERQPVVNVRRWTRDQIYEE